MKTDDLISRKTAIEEICQMHLRNAQNGVLPIVDTVLMAAIKKLKCVPKVEAELVRHGRWIFAGLWEECSCCGYAISVDGPRTNYCPNCGAKMDA